MPTLLSIKEALTLPSWAEASAFGSAGGFILGCSPERYAALAAAERVTVLELGQRVVGFVTSFDDGLFRGSELWARRDRIQWQGFDPSPIETGEEAVAYFDQLAILPDYQKAYLGALLALGCIEDLFREGHQHVFATTLIEPLVNRAAIPLMEKVAARRVGTLPEEYPGVGAVVSAVYHMEERRYRQALGSLLAGGSEVERSTIERIFGAAGLRE